MRRFLSAAILAACLLPGAAHASRRARAMAEPAPETDTREGRNTIRFELATALLDSGHASEAQELLRLAEQEGGDPDEIRFLRARALLISGFAREAEELLVEVHKVHPRDARPLALLCVIRADDGRVEAAIEDCRLATERDPNNAAMWNNLGFLLLSQQSYEEAREALTEAVTRDGRNPRYRNNLGFALAATGRASDALEAFRSVSGEAEAQTNLGVALELIGDPRGATTHYEKAVAADPEYQPARDALARLQTTPPTE